MVNWHEPQRSAAATFQLPQFRHHEAPHDGQRFPAMGAPHAAHVAGCCADRGALMGAKDGCCATDDGWYPPPLNPPADDCFFLSTDAMMA